MRNCSCSLLLCLILCCSTSHGESVRLVPVADTTLFEFQPDYNLGGQVDLPAGTLGNAFRSRLLMRFSLADQIPSGSAIASAQLKVFVTRSPNSQAVFFELHRVLAPWFEGVKSGGIPGGAQASEGESTWNHRVVPDGEWASEGGGLGLDFATESSASERIAGVGAYFFELNNLGLKDLSDWLETPELNQGWVLVARDESILLSARRFAAREDVELSPVLEIEHTPPPPSVEVGEIQVSVSQSHLMIGHSGQSQTLYSLEFRPALGGGAWQVWGSKGPFETALHVEWAVPLSPDASTEGFFRVQANSVIP